MTGKLQALDGLFVYSVILAGNMLHKVIPVGHLMPLALRRDHGQRSVLRQAALGALAAAQAIIGRDLDAVSVFLKAGT